MAEEPGLSRCKAEPTSALCVRARKLEQVGVGEIECSYGIDGNETSSYPGHNGRKLRQPTVQKIEAFTVWSYMSKVVGASKLLQRYWSTNHCQNIPYTE